ncbi:hypothetical protein KM295_14365 [Natronomonas sp. F2-12]|uniref:Uncharacterized protein n=1 Tax=Natronomonas aquatica TaxID=2841590 RepID=A0A9R1CVI8_9EURY|nr:hypothetical protein [Natronomonas aquatica]MCQ4334640.1 hypothetical protein [Natronomonas aquatica]
MILKQYNNGIIVEQDGTEIYRTTGEWTFPNDARAAVFGYIDGELKDAGFSDQEIAALESAFEAMMGLRGDYETVSVDDNI